MSAVTLDDRVMDEAMARITSDRYDDWEDRVRRTGACVRPMRLRGCIHDSAGNTVLDTATMPDGVLYTACKTRRAALCPACAWLYAGDTYRLLREGMDPGALGSLDPDGHPMVFATLTADTFGPVHSIHDDHSRCRHPKGKASYCRHGRPKYCRTRHLLGDVELGEPLCPDCYDYTASVLFNWWAPELWRRFTINLRRHLADLRGVGRTRFNETVRVSFAKVAEFQRRGSVHVHATIRLDAKPPADDPDLVDGPPWGYTTDDLATAVRSAARAVSLTVATDEERDLVLRWGRQLDVQHLAGTGTEDLDRNTRAAYKAKYSTKACEVFGVGPVPITANAAIAMGLRDHVVRIVATCERLASLPGHELLRRWTHMLGFRGHFSTKSRRYSTTLGALRQARATYQRRIAREARGLPVEEDEDTIEVINMTYEGTGYLSTGDYLLARSIAAWTRENRRLAREALRHTA